MTWPPKPVSRRQVSRTDRQKAAGFTLIEVLVTLTILGLSLALISGYHLPLSRGLRLRGAAAELTSALRMARTEAIVRNRPVAFELDLARRRYRIAAAPPRALPPRLTLELLTIAGERRNDTTGAIRFNPDGSSTGGSISIADGDLSVTVGIDWLSGRISVVDGR